MESVQFIEEKIKAFVRTSPLNLMPIMDNPIIYDEPLVGFADGDDPIFTEYKTIISLTHLTPREALAKTYNKSPEDMPAHVSVISWILPITSRIRESNHRHTVTPSRLWGSLEWYGENFHEAMQEHVVEFLTKMGYLAVAPFREPYFEEDWSREKVSSNWSEKHIAYAAGLGTFSFSGNLISECGVAISCGSVVTNLVLPASRRIAENPYSNCLFYATDTCKACAARCPVGAITDSGHDDRKCANRIHEIHYLEKTYNAGRVGCGMCMTKVPCEFLNPIKNQKKRTK